MADVKISALPAIAAAATTDIFAIVQGGVTYKATLTQVIAAIPDATGSTRGILSSADWTTFNSKQSALTFSTGLTNAAGTVTSNLSTGVAGGQSVIGGTAASNNLTLSSTTNATKGKILFGTSAYDEVNNRLGIGTASPSGVLHDVSTATAVGATDSPDTVYIDRYSGGANFGSGSSTIILRRAKGTFSSPLAITSGDSLGGLSIRGYNGSAFSSGGAAINALASESWSTTSNGTELNLFTTQNGTTTSTERLRIFNSGNVFIGASPTDAGYRLDVNGTARVQARLTVSQDTTVATQTSAVITTDTANCSIVLRPTGTGAIIAAAPDGTSTGGNARGTNAVDLQVSRTANTQVASGSQSVIIGGSACSATNTRSAVFCAQQGTASGISSIVLGGGAGGVYTQVAAGDNSVVLGGHRNRTDAYLSGTICGTDARTYLHNQTATSGGWFAAAGDAQRSSISFSRSITGTGIQELFLDGASAAAILNISSPGPTNGRLWNAKIQVSAICQTQGNGTVTVGESLVGNYAVGIKRIGNITSLVGTVQTLHTVQADTNMASSVVTIDANDTNESLRIQFTPPNPEAGSTTVIRVVATAYLTEVGY